MPDTAHPGPRFLIVDDSRVSRNMAIGLLRNRLPGATFLEAGDGDAAVAMFRETPTQVVVMDYNMPGIHGVEAATRIQALSPAVVVVLLTANGQAAVQARAEAAGLVMMCKPLSAALADRIAALAPVLA